MTKINNVYVWQTGEILSLLEFAEVFIKRVFFINLWNSFWSELLVEIPKTTWFGTNFTMEWMTHFALIYQIIYFSYTHVVCYRYQ